MRFLSWQKTCIFKESPVSFYYLHKINIEKIMCRVSEIFLIFKTQPNGFHYYNIFVLNKLYFTKLFKLKILKNCKFFFNNFFNIYFTNFISYSLFFILYNLKKYFYKYFYYFKNLMHEYLSDRLDPLFCVNLQILCNTRIWDSKQLYSLFLPNILFFDFIWYHYKKIFIFKNNAKFNFQNFFYFLNDLNDLTYGFFEAKAKKSLICDRLRMLPFLNFLIYIGFSSRIIYKFSLSKKQLNSKNLFAYKLKFIERFGLDEKRLAEILSVGEDYSMKKLKKEFMNLKSEEYCNFTGKRLLFLEHNVDGLYINSQFENAITLKKSYNLKKFKYDSASSRKIFYLKDDLKSLNPLLDSKRFIENTEEIYYLSNPAARFSIYKDENYLDLLDDITDTELPEEYKGDFFADTPEEKKILESITEDFK